LPLDQVRGILFAAQFDPAAPKSTRSQPMHAPLAFKLNRTSLALTVARAFSVAERMLFHVPRADAPAKFADGTSFVRELCSRIFAANFEGQKP
jgi:hypothetical protein